MVRKIRAELVLQLRAEGLSGRAIAASQGMPRKSITAVLEAADAAGVVWDDIADSTDAEVYARLFPGRGEHQSVFAQPDWDQVHREMARVGVTLKLLHGEYADSSAVAGEPAMGYDRFCRTYQRHVLVTGAASRVGHQAGQSVEVDWSGLTMQLAEPVTGKARTVYLSVGCLPRARAGCRTVERHLVPSEGNHERRRRRVISSAGAPPGEQTRKTDRRGPEATHTTSCQGRGTGPPVTMYLSSALPCEWGAPPSCRASGIHLEESCGNDHNGEADMPSKRSSHADPCNGRESDCTNFSPELTDLRLPHRARLVAT